MCQQILLKITNVKFQVSLVEFALFRANLHINTHTHTHTHTHIHTYTRLKFAIRESLCESTYYEIVKCLKFCFLQQ